MFLSSLHKSTPQLGMPGHQTGFSLVELMIALTLGLIVLLAISSIYIGSQQTYRVQDDNARIQEAGRYTLEVIGRNIRQAGANAEMNFNNTATATQCNVPGVCDAISGVIGATASGVPAPDTLSVQFYAGSEELDTVSGLWMTRDCTGGKVYPASGVAVVTNTFGITGMNLQCTGSVGGAQPLVENVEDLQVVYGIDTDASGSPNYRSADLYVEAPTAAQWPNVVTVRVCALIRSANNGLTTSPQRYLNCAGALGTATGAAAFSTAGDLRLHRSFTATYNLRNRVAASP